MKIVIALGNTADYGGPTTYATTLAKMFTERGHSVSFVSYGPLLRRMPSGIRHMLYAGKLFPHTVNAQAVFAFDTLTVGVPAALACSISRAPLYIRVGGDFLWEQYVERSGDLLKLSNFYTASKSNWTMKERLVYALTKWVIARSKILIFNASFLRNIWLQAYDLANSRTKIIENTYPAHKGGESASKKIFVSAGRNIKLKNEMLLRKVFESIKNAHPDIELDTTSLPREQHQNRIARCYAVIQASISDVSPNGVIDAIVYNKPFICTADTGIKERTGDIGIFVDTQNEKELRDAIERLLDAEEYQQYVTKVTNFQFTRSWEQVADDFLAVIR